MKEARAVAGRGPRGTNKRTNNNRSGLGFASPITRSLIGGYPMSARERLPDRRLSESFEIDISGRKYRCTFSRFSDGRLAEIFLSNNKAGSDSDTAARDSAVVCSIALQFGVPVDVIRKALMRDSAGRPNGPLAAALDLIAGSGV
jgi:hypothetical protein